MRKPTMLGRFFRYLAVYAIVNNLLIALVLSAYGFYGNRTRSGAVEDGLEGIVPVIGAMLLLLPVSLLLAWGASRLLLRPWRSMAERAEEIDRGQLEERIAVDNPADEAGRIAAALNKSFDECQTLLDRLQRFGYSASHQLRNPLAAMRAKGEACLGHPCTAEEYRHDIEEMLYHASQLGRAVDQVMLLARAAGGLHDEYRMSINAFELASKVVDEARVAGELRGLSIELHARQESIAFCGVPDLVREALSNLVDNAIKHTPAGGRIELSIEPIHPLRVRISVSDSGPGLSPAERAAILRPFDRGAGCGEAGAGLGLAVVADVCLAHEGCFGIDDSPLGGCRCWMEYPV